MRQLNNTEYDGVPGVTQCPIAPGQTYTYKFQALQYGSVSAFIGFMKRKLILPDLVSLAFHSAVW
jgi:hypothetical protein